MDSKYYISGMNQANAIIDLATEWGCVENIIGGCCDTASANLGKNNGAIPIMENRLGHPLLKFECQRHVRELHMKFVLFRTVKLCQDFLGTTTKEDKLQNTFQVVSRVRSKTRSQKKTKSSLKLIPTGMN